MAPPARCDGTDRPGHHHRNIPRLSSRVCLLARPLVVEDCLPPSPGEGEGQGRHNISPSQSYVFVANHQGAFDIWAIYGYLDHNFKWLMKKSLEKIPLVGFACRRAGHVFVDDSSVSGIRDTIKEAEGRLRGGMSVVIFPEGSRTRDGRMTPFKRGAFMLAGEFRLPVVPLTISGSFRAMPRTTYNARPGVITLTIHPAIWPGDRGFDTKKLMAECREEIGSALPPEER